MKNKTIHAFYLFQQGDQKGLEYYFKEYYASLVTVSFGYTKDEAISQEIASDVLLYQFNHRDKLNSHNHLQASLFRAVKHRSLSAVRQVKSQQNAKKEYLIGFDEEMEEIMAEHIHYKKVWEVYQQLPKKSKMVIEGLFVKNLSYRELADKMNTTVKNIENIRSYALTKMKNEIIDNKNGNMDKTIMTIMIVFMLTDTINPCNKTINNNKYETKVHCTT